MGCIIYHLCLVTTRVWLTRAGQRSVTAVFLLQSSFYFSPFFLWQHYHGILAWGEWTYSDRCLDLKSYRNTRYSQLTLKVVTLEKGSWVTTDSWPVTTRCQGLARGDDDGHNSPESVVHNIRGALFALLVSPLEPSAEQGDGQAWSHHISLWCLHQDPDLTWHDQQDGDQPHHRGEHHRGEAVVRSLHQDFWKMKWC